MVSSIAQCRNCEHSCHCGNGGVCVSCKCANCEHNALDEFHKNLSSGFNETASKEPYKTFNTDEGIE